MQSFNVKSLFRFSPSHLHNTHTRPFLFTLLSSLSSLTKTPNPPFVDYLRQTFDFSETQSLKLATRYSFVKSLERPRAVVRYFQNLGFTEQQIRSSVRRNPEILILEIDKVLKPKIEFFQQLGLAGPRLGRFFSKTSPILKVSLEKKLVPFIELLKKNLGNDENHEDLLKVLSQCSWLVGIDMDLKLLPNIRFCESRGIVGPHLGMLLKRRPRVFAVEEAAFRNIVSKVSKMGFEMNSKMFVHALAAVACCGAGPFERKVENFKSFGFSRDEYMEMVRKEPNVLTVSTKKSSIGLDFYLNTLKFKKEVVICHPRLLMYSIENRVIPRYRVLEIIKSKRLLKKEPRFLNVVNLVEEVFLERFIYQFADHKEELLRAYKGHILDSFSEEETFTSYMHDWKETIFCARYGGIPIVGKQCSVILCERPFKVADMDHEEVHCAKQLIIFRTSSICFQDLLNSWEFDLMIVILLMHCLGIFNNVSRKCCSLVHEVMKHTVFDNVLLNEEMK